MALSESLKKAIDHLEIALQEMKNMQEFVTKVEEALVAESEPQPKRRRRAASPPVATPTKPVKARRGSTTEAVLAVIQRSPDGTSMDQIKKETGLEGRKVYGVLNRMKKEGKISKNSSVTGHDQDRPRDRSSLQYAFDKTQPMVHNRFD